MNYEAQKKQTHTHTQRRPYSSLLIKPALSKKVGQRLLLFSIAGLWAPVIFRFLTSSQFFFSLIKLIMFVVIFFPFFLGLPWLRSPPWHSTLCFSSFAYAKTAFGAQPHPPIIRSVGPTQGLTVFPWVLTLVQRWYWVTG
jgi:hypothetical protein